jgi:hypothetical protein
MRLHAVKQAIHCAVGLPLDVALGFLHFNREEVGCVGITSITKDDAKVGKRPDAEAG